jgi:hypothetical protein
LFHKRFDIADRLGQNRRALIGKPQPVRSGTAALMMTTNPRPG